MNVPDSPLPPSAEHLIRGALDKLRASQVMDKQVQDAIELLDFVLQHHGTAKPKQEGEK